MASIDRALLDAHVFLWALYSPEKLSRRARGLLASDLTAVQMSAVTVWELLLKIQAGKLNTTQREIAEGLDLLQVRVLPIRTDHLWALQNVAVAGHRDPFDRLLIATAAAEGLPVITADSSFKLHRDIRVIW
ncbi:MAG TPA: type II toxin-antitoxin system VapC family toxin [Bryobacteraceae bacterium]|jgi:PIN domain nuclease of toxin-antitoxin system|nr:type II toxin-antitoxin system VapC family toxin [Bryobacteraceae bacterium]